MPNHDTSKPRGVAQAVVTLEAFGSVLRDDFNTKHSDIDFLLTFNENGRQKYANNFFGLQRSLEELLQRPVELVIASAIKNPYFLENINQTKTMIYAA